MDIFTVESNDTLISMAPCDLDLAGYMSEEKTRAPDELLNIAQQAARELYILHNHDPPTVHTNIKPQSILIQRDDVTDEITSIKLSEIGVSSCADKSQLIDGLTQDDVAETVHGYNKNDGALACMAPEVYAASDDVVGLTEGQDAPADVFALGVTFNFMFCYNSEFGRSPLWSVFQLRTN